MKQTIINKDVMLLEYDTFPINIESQVFPKGSKYICGACAICKKIIQVNDIACENCKHELLKIEEYIAISEYSNWLENRADTLSMYFKGIQYKINENEDYFRNKDIEELKRIAIEKRKSIEEKKYLIVFLEDDIKKIQYEYNIKNIDFLKDIFN